jgi:CelD/BcsL family acetyltransferase involved in cellulose biosynthesis
MGRGAVMTEISIQIVADLPSLAALEPAWWDLWRRAPAATPFQSPAWLLAWWRAFAPGRLASIVLRQGGRLAGLAPLYIEGRGGDGRLLPLGIGVSDYLDLLIDPEGDRPPARLLAAALERLPAWRCLSLEELAPAAAAFALPPPAGCREATEAQSPCPVIDLAGPLPAGIQRRLRRGARRTRPLGGYEIRAVAAKECACFLGSLTRLHGCRWRRRDGETGVLAEAAVQDFHRRALPALAEAGLARLYELRIGGRLAGCYYGFFDRGRAYAYIGGFDPAFAPTSPGNLLIAHAIGEARREGGREFHFLRGREAYKYEWGAVDRWNRCRRFERLPSHAFA